MSKNIFLPRTPSGWLILISIPILLAGIGFSAPDELAGLPTSFTEAFAQAQNDPQNYWFVVCAEPADDIDEIVIDTLSHHQKHYVPMFRQPDLPEGIVCGVYFRHLPMDEPFFLSFMDRRSDNGVNAMWMCWQTMPQSSSGPIHKQCDTIPRVEQSEFVYGIHLFPESPNDTETPLYRLKRQDALEREKAVLSAKKPLTP